MPNLGFILRPAFRAPIALALLSRPTAPALPIPIDRLSSTADLLGCHNPIRCPDKQAPAQVSSRLSHNHTSHQITPQGGPAVRLKCREDTDTHAVTCLPQPCRTRRAEPAMCQSEHAQRLKRLPYLPCPRPSLAACATLALASLTAGLPTGQSPDGTLPLLNPDCLLCRARLLCETYTGEAALPLAEATCSRCLTRGTSNHLPDLLDG